MDSINGLTKIMQIIRRQFAEGSARTGNSNKKKTPESKIANTKSLTVKQLEQQIAAKIKTLDPKDIDYSSKAAAIFVESVLGWEFGDQLFHDAKFNTISHQIQKEILNTPQLLKKLNILSNQYSHGQ